MTDRQKFTLQEILALHKEMTKEPDLKLGQVLGWVVLIVLSARSFTFFIKVLTSGLSTECSEEECRLGVPIAPAFSLLPHSAALKR